MSRNDSEAHFRLSKLCFITVWNQLINICRLFAKIFDKNSIYFANTNCFFAHRPCLLVKTSADILTPWAIHTRVALSMIILWTDDGYRLTGPPSLDCNWSEPIDTILLYILYTCICRESAEGSVTRAVYSIV